MLRSRKSNITTSTYSKSSASINEIESSSSNASAASSVTITTTTTKGTSRGVNKDNNNNNNNNNNSNNHNILSSPTEDMLRAKASKARAPVMSSKKDDDSAARPQQQKWGNLAFAISTAKASAKALAVAQQQEYARNAKAYRMKVCIYMSLCLALCGVGWVLYPTTIQPFLHQLVSEHKDLLPASLLRGAGAKLLGTAGEVSNEKEKELSDAEKSIQEAKAKGKAMMAALKAKKSAEQRRGDVMKPDGIKKESAADGTEEDQIAAPTADDSLGQNLVGASVPKACVNKGIRQGRPGFHNGSFVVDCQQYFYKMSFDVLSEGKLMTVLWSKVQDAEQRSFIRKTWGARADSKPYFLVHGSAWEDIANEYEEHEDIIYMELPPSINNVETIKVLGFLLIAEQHGRAYKDILVAADDTHVGISELQQKLAQGGVKKEKTDFPARLVKRKLAECGTKSLSTEFDATVKPFDALDLLAKDCGMPHPNHIKAKTGVRTLGMMQMFDQASKRRLRW